MCRDKQIEKMAKDFCALNMPCEECHLYKNRCHAKKYATRAYNAGYRKASEVALEVIDEIEQNFEIGYGGVLEFKKFLAELKKKYTKESEKDNG